MEILVKMKAEKEMTYVQDAHSFCNNPPQKLMALVERKKRAH